MKTLKQKLKIKGSALAFSLIIMGMMLVAALGLASVSSIERKTSSGSNKSNQSFQVADSGVEKVLNRIKNANSVIDIADTGSGLTCNSSSGNISANLSNGTVDVALFDENEAKIRCNSSTSPLAAVRKIKSVGTFAGTTRAIEAAVAQTVPPVGTCRDSGDMIYIQFWTTNTGCRVGWNQCEEAKLLTAGRIGCLPSVSQYSNGGNAIQGSTSNGVIRSNSDGYWYIGVGAGVPSLIACCVSNN